MSDLPHDRALALMAMPKWCDARLVWAERDNHAGVLMATAQPVDDTGAILPGMTLQFNLKRPIVVDRCLYELTLFQLDRHFRRRAYQLSVTPRDKRSHNSSAGPLYGPHEHVGDRVLVLAENDLACGRLGVAFAHFFRRIALSFTGELNLPL